MEQKSVVWPLPNPSKDQRGGQKYEEPQSHLDKEFIGFGGRKMRKTKESRCHPSHCLHQNKHPGEGGREGADQIPTCRWRSLDTFPASVDGVTPVQPSDPSSADNSFPLSPHTWTELNDSLPFVSPSVSPSLSASQ